MGKEEFITRRTQIMSDMLDNPDEKGMYPTTIAYAEFDDLFDEITQSDEPLSGAQVAELEAILGVEVLREFTPCLVDVGMRWVVAQLANAGAVLATRPDLPRMKLWNPEDETTGVVIFGEHPREASARIEVRAFAPTHGVDEDPVQIVDDEADSGEHTPVGDSPGFNI